MGAHPPLWRPTPDRAKAAILTAFLAAARDRTGRDLPDYPALWDWSVTDVVGFWDLMWDFGGVIGDKTGPVLSQPGDMATAQFFPDARINFAENLFQGQRGGIAIRFRAQDRPERTVTWARLRDQVSRLQRELAALGVGPGDRVAAVAPNMPETVAALLAASSLGAVFSSCSPDFGVDGVFDRFGQIAPKVLFGCDGYVYGDRDHDVSGRLAAIVDRLPSLTTAILWSYHDPDTPVSETARIRSWARILAEREAGPLTFTRVPFNAPLLVVFSSGTTGKPKCILHRVGGTVVQNIKEHRLQGDIRPGDTAFYFTTTGWVMWNWLAGALMSGAQILAYDGSPTHPDPGVLFRYAEQTGATHFGTSARYLHGLLKSGYRPRDHHDLSAVRAVLSTGSPLSPEGFRFVYDHIAPDVHLASISGGTDILGAFVGGNPLGPVHGGEIQAPGLGMKVDIFGADGRPVKPGQTGELVCTAPFPTLPLGFWGDGTGARYRKAYFERFPGVWCHGDLIEQNPRTGGYVIHGRSDAVLNPGGVRIGTAEIYRQVEHLDAVEEAVCIGQDIGDDTRIVLFVRLRPGIVLDDGLEDAIRARIRAGLTPRHVPKKILAVPDIPRTKSGKVVELAVRDVVHGRPVVNTTALANPEALDHFSDRPELAGP